MNRELLIRLPSYDSGDRVYFVVIGDMDTDSATILRRAAGATVYSTAHWLQRGGIERCLHYPGYLRYISASSWRHWCLKHQMH